MSKLKESYTYDGVHIEIYNELNIHKLTETLHDFAITYDLYEEVKGE